MNWRDVERTIFWIVPAGVLLAAFAGLCVMTGTAWPWAVVVHEDGVRTLAGTVFFVEHAARELLLDAVFALAIGGAVRYYFPPVAATGATASRWRTVLGLLTLVVVVGIVGGTLWTEGPQSLIDNLAQFHTRAGAPLVWGAHWRYHLIGRFAQIMLVFSMAGTVWLLHGRPARTSTGRFRLYGAALIAYAILTIVFLPTTEPFRDPAFLGHQLRELFTHTLVTLPLAFGTCLALARRFSTQTSEPAFAMATAGPRQAWPIVATGLIAVACGTFLLAASLLTGAQSHGQATGLAWLLLPHFFEHSIGYVMVSVLAGALYLTPVRSGIRPPQ